MVFISKMMDKRVHTLLVLVLFVVLFSVVVVELTREEEPDIQMVQQDKSPPEKAEVIAGKSIEDKHLAQVEKQITKSRVSDTKTHEQVSASADMDQLWSQGSINDDLTNLAVLSETSEWLESDAGFTVPDLTDMPELSEIDALFDTT